MASARGLSHFLPGVLRGSSRRAHLLALVAILPVACFAPGDDEEPPAGEDSSTGMGTGGMTSVPGPDDASTSTAAPGSTSSEDPGTTTTEASETAETTETTETPDDESTGAAEDRDPPEVVSIDPPHGSSGVVDDPVTIDFSEPVDTASVESAFPTATAFEWSNGDRTVSMTIPFPFEAQPVLYDLVVPTSVRDVAGNELEAEVVATVGLAALSSVTLEYDADLTGNVTATTSAGTFFMAGDTDSDQVLYTGISFPLDALPDHDAILKLRSATFGTQITRMLGDPNDAAMGGFVVDHVTFSTREQIADPVVVDSAFHDLHAAGDVMVGEAVSIDVTDALESSWSFGEPRLQFRVRPMAASLDGASDLLYLRRRIDENDAIIAEGVADPDEANRARIEVEYFVQ